MMKHEQTNFAEDALREVRSKSWPEPAREPMLAQAYLRAEQTKEDSMTMFDRLFAGRPLVARLGIAAALLLMLAAAAVLLPRSMQLTAEGPRAVYQAALAATESVVLNYDLSSFDLDEAHSKFKEIEQAAQASLPEGVKLLNADIRAEVRREKRVVKVVGEQGTPQESETRVVNGILVLSEADDGAVAQVREAVSRAVRGVGEALVQDATWFREQGVALEGGTFIGLNINGENHAFNFPEGTSAEQMESDIRGWLAEAHPGREFDVDVDVSESGSGDKVQKRVEIRIEGEDHAEE